MPKTLLAIDDSVTMRKVLEITFNGDDFRVITAENSASAHARLSENPKVIVVDTVLGSEDGYDLARELRKKSPSATILLLTSRYNPYDAARAKEAGADDFADKPFDTQQLIDKVKKAMTLRDSGPVQVTVAAQPPVQQKAPERAVAQPAQPPAHQGVNKATQPSLGGEVRKNATLIFGEPALSPPSPPPAPVLRAPVAAPVAPAVAATPPAAAASMAASVNAKLGPKLDGLGLSQSQAEAVLALSRDVVERVVWEVVPQLAEALIKEEIARLMR